MIDEEDFDLKDVALSPVRFAVVDTGGQHFGCGGPAFNGVYEDGRVTLNLSGQCWIVREVIDLTGVTDPRKGRSYRPDLKWSNLRDWEVAVTLRGGMRQVLFEMERELNFSVYYEVKLL